MRQPSRYRSNSTNSSMVWILFCPAPNVTVGMPCLTSQFASSPPLRFAGLQCYHGPAQHLRTPGQRADAIAQATDAARRTRTAIEASGLRGYVAPMYRSGRWFTPDGKRVEYEWDADDGRSGFDRATCAMPMPPPAPPLFSTTTGWSRIRASASATGRPTVSATPPGGKGTTMVSGLLG